MGRHLQSGQIQDHRIPLDAVRAYYPTTTSRRNADLAGDAADATSPGAAVARSAPDDVLAPDDRQPAAYGFCTPRRSLRHAKRDSAVRKVRGTRHGASAHTPGCARWGQRRPRANSLRSCFRPERPPAAVEQTPLLCKGLRARPAGARVVALDESQQRSATQYLGKAVSTDGRETLPSRARYARNRGGRATAATLTAHSWFHERWSYALQRITAVMR